MTISISAHINNRASLFAKLVKINKDNTSNSESESLIDNSPKEPEKEPKKPKKKSLIWIAAGCNVIIAVVSILWALSDNKPQQAKSDIIENEIIVKKEQQKAAEQELQQQGFIRVEGGEFDMGNINGESDERPVHKAKVNTFYISKCEITQEEWSVTMGNNPSYFKGNSRPVENVSWYDCIEYCNARSKNEGLEECYIINNRNITLLIDKNGYRLPTEAEWEYAAMGGAKSMFYKYSGSNDTQEVAWNKLNSRGATYTVGQKLPNELGIYDMSGNVYEWCWDWYGQYPSSTHSTTGPAHGTQRVNRGGSFKFIPKYCSVTFRSNRAPEDKLNRVGFRVVRCLE